MKSHLAAISWHRRNFAELLAKKCPPELVRTVWQSEAGYSEELWQAMAELGVLALTVPESFGGLGMDEIDLVKLLEEAGRAAAPVPILEHVAVGVPALAEAAETEFVERWLALAATGEVLVTAAVDASLVNYAAQADLAILSHQGQLFAVERQAYRAEELGSVDGSRRLAEVEWSFDEAMLLPGASAGLAFERGALATAAQCLGVAALLLDTTVAYVQEREQFGKPVGSYQAVKHHLADVAKDVGFARPSVYAAAWAVSQGASELSEQERQKFVSAAKSWRRTQPIWQHADACSVTVRLATPMSPTCTSG